MAAPRDPSPPPPPVTLRLRSARRRTGQEEVRRLRALCKHLRREWGYVVTGFSAPDLTPVMLTPGEGI